MMRCGDLYRSEMPDANAKDYSNEVVVIHNLAVTSQVISNKDFSNCTIVGPAFILVQDNNTITNCKFESHDVLIKTDDLGVNQVFGAIAVEGCTFAGCRFEKINLLVPGNIYRAFHETLADS